MNNKKESNELLEFLGGLAMLVAGLYWFSTNVLVTSTFFSGFRVGSVGVNSGMVMVPFIIAIILVFVKPESFGTKLFLGLTVLLIIAAVISSTRIQVSRMTLFEWAGILILMFGGLGLVCKILFKPVKKKENEKDEK